MQTPAAVADKLLNQADAFMGHADTGVVFSNLTWFEGLYVVLALALAIWAGRRIGKILLQRDIQRFKGLLQTKRIAYWLGFWGCFIPLLALLGALQYLLGAGSERLHATLNVFQLVFGLSALWWLSRLVSWVINRFVPLSPNTLIFSTLLTWMVLFLSSVQLLGLDALVWGTLHKLRFSIGGTATTMAQVFKGVLWLMATMMLALWTSSVLDAWLNQRKDLDSTAQRLYGGLLRSIVLFAGFMMALSLAGVSFTALSVFGGALGVGIGFGLQKIAANYISGFVLLAERSLRIGDMVKVLDVQGTVADIRTRYTLIHSTDGLEVVVPNETIVTTTIKNMTFSNSRLLLTTTVWVGYEYAPHTVLTILAQSTASVPRVLADPAPTVALAEYLEKAVKYQISFWINDPENGQLSIISTVNVAAWEALVAANIRMDSADIARQQFTNQQ